MLGGSVGWLRCLLFCTSFGKILWKQKVVGGKFISDEKGHELFQISQKIVLYDPEKKTF